MFLSVKQHVGTLLPRELLLNLLGADWMNSAVVKIKPALTTRWGRTVGPTGESSERNS